MFNSGKRCVLILILIAVIGFMIPATCLGAEYDDEGAWNKYRIPLGMFDIVESDMRTGRSIEYCKYGNYNISEYQYTIILNSVKNKLIQEQIEEKDLLAELDMIIKLGVSPIDLEDPKDDITNEKSYNDLVEFKDASEPPPLNKYSDLMEKYDAYDSKFAD